MDNVAPLGGPIHLPEDTEDTIDTIDVNDSLDPSFGSLVTPLTYTIVPAPIKVDDTTTTFTETTTRFKPSPWYIQQMEIAARMGGYKRCCPELQEFATREGIAYGSVQSWFDRNRKRLLMMSNDATHTTPSSSVNSKERFNPTKTQITGLQRAALKGGLKRKSVELKDYATEQNLSYDSVLSWFNRNLKGLKSMRQKRLKKASSIEDDAPEMPTQPITVLTQPIVVPTQPITVPTQPIVVPTQPITMPTQPITVLTKVEQIAQAKLALTNAHNAWAM